MYAGGSTVVAKDSAESTNAQACEQVGVKHFACFQVTVGDVTSYRTATAVARSACVTMWCKRAELNRARVPSQLPETAAKLASAKAPEVTSWHVL